MAKKKPDGRALIKTLVKATVNRNTVLPALEHVYLAGDELRVTDLETSVKIPFTSGIDACVPFDRFLDILEMMETPHFSVDKNFAVVASEGKRKVKVMGITPNDYPKTFYQDEYFEFGRLREEDMVSLKTAVDFTSNDDLRPAMTGVFFSENIVATDAHRLFWKKIEPMAENFILPKKAASILLKIGGEWRVFGDTHHVVFLNGDGIMVEARVIDARFPDYKCVIPTDDNIAAFAVNPTELHRELKNALKFANRSTNMVTISLNGKATISSQDVDFDFEYQNEFTLAEIEFHEVNQYPWGLRVQLADGRKGYIRSTRAGGVWYQVEVDPDELVSEITKVDVKHSDLKPVPEFKIAFNGEFLDDIALRLKDEPIMMRLWSPSKCAIINEQFLLMPLMLNE